MCYTLLSHHLGRMYHDHLGQRRKRFRSCLHSICLCLRNPNHLQRPVGPSLLLITYILPLANISRFTASSVPTSSTSRPHQAVPTPTNAAPSSTLTATGTPTAPKPASSSTSLPTMTTTTATEMERLSSAPQARMADTRTCMSSLQPGLSSPILP